MFLNDERETKELELGTSSHPSNEAPVSNTPNTSENNNPEPKPVETTGSGGGDNSFYDRQPKKQVDTVWYKDWRGKTLGISIAALLLIGAGIPAGMAAAGYWSVKEENYHNDNTLAAYNLAEDEINMLYDTAIIDHFDAMAKEGWITQKSHDKAIDDAEESASDTIDSDRENLKDKYGNTDEDEWDKLLQEKGFHTSDNGGEDEYKDSLISSSIESTVKGIYTNKNKATDKVKTSDPDGWVYKSSSMNNYGQYAVVKNSYKNDVEVNSYTPQDLMTMYLYTYQPVVFNNSLLPFSPVVGNSEEATITGNNVSMTNDQIKNAWALAVKSDDTEFVASDNFGGIQSANSISFSSQSLDEEANIAIIDAHNGNASKGTPIKDIVSTAFTAAGLDISTVNSDIIDYMDDDAVTLFENSIAASLQKDGLLNTVDTSGGATTMRNFSTTGVMDNKVSFVDTNGLNNIGIEVKDKEIVDEQLNNLVKDDNARDFDLWTSYSSWVSDSFKYITIIDYLTDPSDNSNWFTYDTDGAVKGINVEKNDNFDKFISNVKDAYKDNDEVDGQDVVDMLQFAFVSDIVSTEVSNISTYYTSAKSFVQTNKKYYDYDAFIDDDGVGEQYVNYYWGTNQGKFIKKHYVDSTGTRTITPDVVLNKGGDQ